MGHGQADVNERPEFDRLLQEIAEYVCDYELCMTRHHDAFQTARHTLLDALGCGFLGLRFPECIKVGTP
jgi:2-methylcitrate dehydratase